jgi:hypothetical protein
MQLATLAIWPGPLALRRRIAPVLPLIIFPRFHLFATETRQKRTKRKESILMVLFRIPNRKNGLRSIKKKRRRFKRRLIS